MDGLLGCFPEISPMQSIREHNSVSMCAAYLWEIYGRRRKEPEKWNGMVTRDAKKERYG